MTFMKDEELVERYKGAVAIYALERKKKLTKKEKIFDWAIALFSPLPGIVYDGNQYAVFKELISGKTIFTLNI